MTGKFVQLPLKQLQAGRFQPRKQFAHTELQELSKSIAESGVVQPIVVRKLRADCYEIIAGERRFRAAVMAGLDALPCMLHHYNDEQAAKIATIENINRVDLNLIEMAQAYKRLVDEFQYTHDEVAAVVGKSREAISNILRLLKLHPQVQDALIDGELSAGHAKVLAGLDESQQQYYLPQLLKQHWPVKKLVSAIKLGGKTKNKAIMDVDADVAQLQRDIGDYLGCEVKIDYQQDKKCELKLQCFNLEVLDGVLAKMGYEA